MPNHVTHTMQVTGPPDAVQQFKSLHIVHVPEEVLEKWDKSGTYTAPAYDLFDFDTIIPRPAILDEIPSGSQVDDAVEAITGKHPWELDHLDLEHRQMRANIHAHVWNDPQKEAERKARLENLPIDVLELGMKALQAIEETGYHDWYEWSVAKWGTKWNSYDLVWVTDEPGLCVFRFDTAWSTPEPVLVTLCEMHPRLVVEIDGFDECGNFAVHGFGVNGSFLLSFVPSDDSAYERAYGCSRVHDEDTLDAAVDALQALPPAEELPDPLGPPDASVEPLKNGERRIDFDDD